MNIKDIQSIARSMNLKPGKLKKTDLIRLIQKEEGNNVCYASSAVSSYLPVAYRLFEGI